MNESKLKLIDLTESIGEKCPDKSALRLSVLTENIGERCLVKAKTISEDFSVVHESTAVNQESLDVVLSKVEMCPNLDSLLSLEKEMNEIGLSFYTNQGGKAVLCKIVGGLPSITSAMSDYIVLGLIGKNSIEISDRMATCLRMFITAAASGPTKIENKPRSWQAGPVLYAQK